MGFEIGDLVWAKMKGFPPWPAQIIEPTIATAKVPKNKKAHQFVLFFGSNDCAWILEENIMIHNESILKTLSKKKSKAYQHAIDELANYLGTKSAEKPSSKMKEKPESGKKTTKVIRIARSPSKKHGRNVLVQKSLIKKTSGKRGIDDNKKSSENSPSKSSELAALDNLTERDSDKGTDSNRHSLKREQFWENLPGCSSDLSEKYEPDNKHLEVPDAMDLNNEDSDTKFDKKIGFIGLDELGKSILTKFIECGMDVTLWHNNINQYAKFTENDKAKLADSPAQLIHECDITFCYDTDSDSLRNIVFNEKGILEGFEEAERLQQRKGFVVLNSIDNEISNKINEVITIRSGYYLEAPILSTSESINDGEVIVLASGNRDLYTSCQKYFQVIAGKVLFLSCEIGASSKMSVMLNAASGTILAAMSEAMVLSDRLELKKDDVHQIFKNVFLGDTLGKKMRKMSEHDYSRMIPLKHVQKDMNFALNLADGVSQSMPVTSAANEVFKHARLLKYSDSDVSSIYKVVKLF